MQDVSGTDEVFGEVPHGTQTTLCRFSRHPSRLLALCLPWAVGVASLVDASKCPGIPIQAKLALHHPGLPSLDQNVGRRDLDKVSNCTTLFNRGHIHDLILISVVQITCLLAYLQLFFWIHINTDIHVHNPFHGHFPGLHGSASVSRGLEKHLCRLTWTVL